jgi:hypothetical protein
MNLKIIKCKNKGKKLQTKRIFALGDDKRRLKYPEKITREILENQKEVRRERRREAETAENGKSTRFVVPRRRT